MDFVITALTENSGRIRHHFKMGNETWVVDIVTHAVVLFASVYKDCGDFVITCIECNPVTVTGAFSNSRV